MSHTATDSEERRGRERHQAYFPAYMTVEQNLRSALVKDLSAQGAMLLTRAHPVEGSEVQLQLHIAPESEPTKVKARVLRVERWGNGKGWWPYSVAVRFDKALNKQERAVATLSKRQREIGVLPK